VNRALLTLINSDLLRHGKIRYLSGDNVVGTSRYLDREVASVQILIMGNRQFLFSSKTTVLQFLCRSCVDGLNALEENESECSKC
jgi:hypothetical protein